MRWLTILFVALIALLQYPLWLGKGSWLRVWDLNQQIDKQKETNTTLKIRNDTVDAEVRDLKQGYAAIEERARSELGMIKQDEVFYQMMDGSGLPSVPPASSAPGEQAESVPQSRSP
ncbi:MAG: cell division protein FtsB [Methylobacillus sp.]|nr:cell division protein FtsB [Methylobacillus sp.]